jgi:hypothetical protein
VEAAVVLGRDGQPYEVGLVWIVRDSKRNRELVRRYRHIFDAYLPGSSVGWLRALTDAGAPMPKQSGLLWSDGRATRLFAHRR